MRFARENDSLEDIGIEIVRATGIVDCQPGGDRVKMRIVHALERSGAVGLRIVESRHTGSRGILLPWNNGGLDLVRLEPSDDLASFVERHWVLRWELGNSRHTQRIIGFPCVDIVFEADRARIYGPRTAVLEREFTGSGRVFATKLRPGAWPAFSPLPVAALVNSSQPVADLFGLEPRLNDNDDDCQRVVEDMLRACAPRRDPRAELAAQIVTRILDDPSIVRADQVGQRFEIRERALQRLFARYVGVGVKALIKQSRLQLAAEQLRGTRPTAALALELGYSDQAHFDHDFREFLGVRPGRYARD